MPRLYLLRHGVAVPHGTPGVAEDQRPLTPDGERKVERIGEGLKRLKVEPDRVVTSPLPRARRTARIVADALGLSDALEDSDALVPAATPAAIRDWLNARNEADLMLVGHNPNLTGLLALLIGLPPGLVPFELRKGGLAALEGVERGSYQLHWLATPKLIRRLLD